MSRIAARFLVEGRVQGVWFRGSTQEQARRLGINGQAINLRDGSVEVLAVGDAAAIEELADWLWQGPPLAEVSRVEREARDVTSMAGFDDFATG